MEEYTTMAQISAEIGSIKQMIEARDHLDAERRKVDDARDLAASKSREELLNRVDGHGDRLRTLEVNWTTFFGENGAFTFVRRKIESMDRRDNAILALLLATLTGIITVLVKK